jgi:hypothetical protein
MRSGNRLFLVAFLLGLLGGPGVCADLPRAWGASQPVFDHTHARFDAILKAYVAEDLVYYRGLAEEPGDLEAYLEDLAGARGEPDWTREERLAFWINAYNALTLEVVARHYPIEGGGLLDLHPDNSIRQIDGVWDEITWNVAGREVTLDQIEHEILRGELSEPRIHFAIVCASIGCPPLRPEAYRADRIEEQLEAAARDFVNDPAYVRLEPQWKRTGLSKIFRWFHEDFDRFERESLAIPRVDGAYRGALTFVHDRLDSEEARAYVAGGDYRIDFLDYDWSLNERDTPPGEKARRGSAPGGEDGG